MAGCSSQSGTDQGGNSKKVTIQYWQYTYPTKVTEIKKLIKEFEHDNPNITVETQDYPHDEFVNKVLAAQKAGVGPDVVNLYNGWIPQFVKQKAIQPIPTDFMSKKEIQDYYVDAVQPEGTDGKYYSLPTAVRTLALLWNKDLFKKAGLDPNTPPQTWDELIADAKKMTIRSSDGRLQQEGYGWNAGGQGYHTFEEVLLRQWGVVPFSQDGKKVLWNSSPAGLEAFKFWVEMETKDKIGAPDFTTDYSTAFLAGKAGMIDDGSFRIGDLKTSKLNYGVTTLPVREIGGTQSNFVSYWTNALSSGISGAKLQAGEKWMKFLISEDVQRDWLKNVGEIPASKALLNDKSITADPTVAPFVEALKYAHTTPFVNEDASRASMINRTNEIILKGASIEKTFDALVAEQQKICDGFYGAKG